MIIFEGVDINNKKKVYAPGDSFENSFMEAMIRKVPSVCISTHHCEAGTETLVDLLERGVPVLLLDSRERWPLVDYDWQPSTTYAAKTKSLKDPRAKQAEFIERLSSSAGVLSGMEQSTNPMVSKRLSFDQGSGRARAASGSKRRNFDRVDIARDILREDLRVMLEDGAAGNGAIDLWEIPLYAFLHGMMNLKSMGDEEGGQYDEAWLGQAIIKKQAEQAQSKGLQAPTEEKQKLADALCGVFFEEYNTHVNDARIKTLQNSIKDFPVGESEAATKKKEKLEEALRDELRKKESNDLEADRDEWISLSALLTNASTFSESVYDIDCINRALGDVAHIDRLPTNNTLQGSLLLQKAWDCVDFYNVIADRFKLYSKVSYAVMMVLGIFVIGAGVFSANYPDLLDKHTMSMCVLGLSIASGATTAFVTNQNPALRWQQLRSAWLEIQADIWMFRTRAVKYREASKAREYNRPENVKFHDTLKNVRDRVLESTDLKKTTFYGKSKEMYARHGQHATNEQTKPEGDNHHSPLQPEDYIELRLKAEANFYKRRIPSYGRLIYLSQVVLIGGAWCSQCSLTWS